MLPQSHLAVITRNETWQGPGTFETEPYECGWAREAMFFVRALKPVTLGRAVALRVQVSPDGMRWVDQGATVALPANEQEMTVATAQNFGGWLRLVGELKENEAITVLVSIHLKA